MHIVDDPHIGRITMPQEGAISIAYPDDRDYPPLVIRRAEHPDAYDDCVMWAGGINVGETKKLIPYTALVSMKDDRSITVSWADSNSSGEIVQEPYIENITPGSSI